MEKIVGKKSSGDFMQMAYDEMLKSRQDNEKEKVSPLVGAVVVMKKDNELFYVAAHRGHTRDGHHAEESVLDDLNRNVDFTDAEIYVTLEPCVPEGRSADKISCAERIVDARISKVYIGMIDPNPNIKNKGIKYLLDKGISVQLFDRDIRKKIEYANSKFINTPFDDIDYEKLESDILRNLSKDGLEYFAKHAKIDISEGYGNLWNHLIYNQLIYKEGKKYKVTEDCGIAFGEKASSYCKGAVVQLFINYSKENLLNTTGMSLERRFKYDGPMILITEILSEWLKDHFFESQDRAHKNTETDFIVPFALLKEAVVNAIVHREYGSNGGFSYIKIQDYSLSINNPSKISQNRFDNMKSFKAKSNPVNPGLTELFMDALLMERSGSGMATFRKATPTPIYEYEDDFISISFAYSNRNAYELFIEKYKGISKEDYATYEYIISKESASRLDVQENFQIPEKTANNRLAKLEKSGIIKKTGSGRSTKYIVV